MKKYYFLVLGLSLLSSVNAQIIEIPDPIFKAKLLEADITKEIAYNLDYSRIKIDSNNNGEIEVSEALMVDNLNVSDTNISSLEGLSFFTNLSVFSCINTAITSLDISPLRNLYILNAWDNSNLKYLNLKNGSIDFNIPEPPPAPAGIGNATFNDCPNLEYVCTNEDKINNGEIYLNNNYPSSNITLNSYCSITQGIVFFTVQGVTKLDTDNNGCDENDVIYPNLKFSISDGVNDATFTSNDSGNYTIPFQSGTHTITPILEYPEYFTVTPTSIEVSDSIQSEFYTQNFCVTPKIIIHNDLEITLLPIGVARPGFDSNYKIIYKNNGNLKQSGAVIVTFNDAVLDLVTANPTATNQVLNNLSWDFTNLLPLESRVITFTMNVNSPVETPAVNNGDFLNFNATISSSNTDETPNDNIFAFHQTVVGSYDPNDKTCLEGDTITPEMIGSDVHYLIRFENTGTYHAENIVVKDMIDTTKFDISTLVPVRGSHEFVTKISEGNKVEFIFENINLPFDDANNDGFVTFKIKTKPTLTLGDSFSNTASIYFDYNAPIVTNTTNTTIAVLGKQDFEFSNYFSLYPNPASSTLLLNVKKEIEVKSVNIYNTLGQLVLVIPNAQQVKTVDVSSLSQGNYFIKLNTDRGSVIEQFVKN